MKPHVESLERREMLSTNHIVGTDGDDLITVESNHEPAITQDYDAGAYEAPFTNYDEQLLYEAFNQRTYIRGGDGADTFYFELQIDAIPEIAAKHADADTGVIDWMGVAGENNNVHDHWVNSLGRVWIKDFSSAEGDQILIDGHTVEIESLDYLRGRNGQIHTRINLQSNQGAGGGAHNLDQLGNILVKNAILSADDITVNNTNHGVTDTLDEFNEQDATNITADDVDAFIAQQDKRKGKGYQRFQQRMIDDLWNGWVVVDSAGVETGIYS